MCVEGVLSLVVLVLVVVSGFCGCLVPWTDFPSSLYCLAFAGCA